MSAEGSGFEGSVSASPRDARGWLRLLMILILTGIPIVLLVGSVVSWLRIGIDVPVADDWRPYLDREALSLDIGVLFRPQNDTIFPVGKVLDVIAIRTFGGNTVIYQALSMIAVLGGLLVLQWVLLKMAFRDTLHAAIAFSLCSLMFVKGSYWGGPNIAYHQGLPLLFILAALPLALRTQASTRWTPVAAFALGTLAGLTYVSGAFAALVAGGVLVIIGLVGSQPSRHAVSRVGAGLSVAGLLTLGLQFWAIRSVQGDQSMAGNPFTFPWQPEFWYYLAGKVGASLGLPADRPEMAILVTVAAVAATVVALIWSLLGLRRRRRQPPRADVVSVVTLALAATILVYLVLIAAGRASLRPVEGPATAVEVFQFGFFRFHFFWATLIWPWVGAVGLSIGLGLTESMPRLRGTVLTVAAVIALAAVVAVGRFGKFDFAEFYERWAGARLDTYSCLLESRQRNDGFECSIGIPQNPAPLILYADSIGASWVRYLQPLPRIPSGQPVFTLSDRTTGQVDFIDAEVLDEDGPRVTLAAGEDAQLIINVADAEAMRECLTLELSAVLRPSEEDVAQLFYRPPGDTRFSPARVATARVTADGVDPSTVSLMVTSEAGFADELRFDPVFDPQEVDLTDLELYCRWSAR